jgi:phosphoribosylformylglycinamidine synthase
MESKGSIISTSAVKACTALGIKPRLKYKSKQSKISFGIAQKTTHQNPIITGHEELLFLQDNKVLVSACADIMVLESVIVKHINPASLGYGLNSISNNKYGMDIYLSSAAQISILSDKNTHGVLIIATQYLSGKIKGICKKHKQSCVHLGSLKKIQFMSISVRKKMKANLPLSILNITEPPKISIVPAVPKSGKKEKLKTFKELKNYSSHVLELCKIVKKQKWNVYKPQKDSVGSFSLIPGKNDFAVSIPDNIHLLNKEIKTSNRIVISNAARQLVCKGYKPIGVALILHGGNMKKNDNQWYMREIFMGAVEAAQLMGIEIFRPIMTCDNKNHPGLELCVVGKRINESIAINESFVSENDFITMLGSHRGELSSSIYQQKIQKQENTKIPAVDLRMETRLQETVLQGIQTGLIKSAVNISNGGLAVSLVKSLQNAEKVIGARIHLSRKLRQDEMLFGETQGMVIVSIGERDLMEFERICMTIGLPSTTIGRVTGDGRFKFNDVVNLDVNKL